MYNIFIRSRGWISLISCALTLLVVLVTVTDSQSVSDTSLAWPYHYYAPAFSHSEEPVVLSSPYHYLGTNRDRRILNIFKKGAGPQLVIRKKDSGHSSHGHSHGHGHGWGHSGGHSSHSSSGSKGGGLLKGWLPKKSFGVHVTGGLGFSFGGDKEEKKKESHGWQPVQYGWGSYGHGHQQKGHGWGSYHRPSHGWGHYKSPHGQHSYGWGGYDDEYSHDDNERSAIAVEDLEAEDEEVEAEERADLRPRLLLVDNLYEDEDELPFVYSQEYDEYY